MTGRPQQQLDQQLSTGYQRQTVSASNSYILSAAQRSVLRQLSQRFSLSCRYLSIVSS